VVLLGGLEARALDDPLTGYRHDARALVRPTLVAPQALLPAEPPCSSDVADGLEGEFVLDRDVSCLISLRSGATLDLGGFTVSGTVTTDNFTTGATVRNGTIVGSVDFSRCGDCLLEDLQIRDGQSFVVQPGGGNRIDRCTFSGNDVAVDIFFGTRVTITNSVFEDNDIAVNVANENFNVIASSVFRDNRTAIRLFNEDSFGVYSNRIRESRFEANDVGVAFALQSCSDLAGPDRCMVDNDVFGNEFTDNGIAGILYQTLCDPTLDDCFNLDSVEASIEDNSFAGNGFGDGAGDGITMRGERVARDGVTIARNLALANADLGIDADGAIDGGGNRARGNGNPLQCVGVACALAGPVIEVTPEQVDFGEVVIGASAPQIVTVGNTGDDPLLLEAIELVDAVGTGFALLLPPLPTEILPGGSLEIGIEFRPRDEGSVLALLRITSGDPDTPVVEVVVEGSGVPDDDQAMALLAFFDEAVASGELVGNGPPPRARTRLRVLRHLIESAGDRLDRGRGRRACAQLEIARRRTDGLPRPPDFAAGPAAPALEAGIAQLRSSLGCAAPTWFACGLGAELPLLLGPLWVLRRKRPRVAQHDRAD
jgi:hypothetical protein